LIDPRAFGCTNIFSLFYFSLFPFLFVFFCEVLFYLYFLGNYQKGHIRSLHCVRKKGSPGNLEASGLAGKGGPGRVKKTRGNHCTESLVYNCY
jgi:hypothetical protein